MSTCPNCGGQLADDGRVCERCCVYRETKEVDARQASAPKFGFVASGCIIAAITLTLASDFSGAGAGALGAGFAYGFFLLLGLWLPALILAFVALIRAEILWWLPFALGGGYFGFLYLAR
jgi:hypothetical protein